MKEFWIYKLMTFNFAQKVHLFNKKNINNSVMYV